MGKKVEGFGPGIGPKLSALSTPQMETLIFRMPLGS